MCFRPILLSLVRLAYGYPFYDGYFFNYRGEKCHKFCDVTHPDSPPPPYSEEEFPVVTGTLVYCPTLSDYESDDEISFCSEASTEDEMWRSASADDVYYDHYLNEMCLGDDDDNQRFI